METSDVYDLTGDGDVDDLSSDIGGDNISGGDNNTNSSDDEFEFYVSCLILLIYTLIHW